MPTPVQVENVDEGERVSSPRESITSRVQEVFIPLIASAHMSIEELLEEARQRSNDIRDLNTLSQELRKMINGKDKDVNWGRDDLGPLVAKAKELGVVFPDDQNKDSARALIENIKTVIDGLTSTNEMEMLRMQRKLNFVNALIQAISSVDSKEDNTISVVIRKIGG